MAWHFPMARLSPRSTMSRVQLILSRSTSPVARCWISWVTVNIDLTILYRQGGLASSAGIPTMTDSGLSPHRDHAISTNISGGVGGWLSDAASCGTTSQIRVVCEVIWVVVVVCSTGCLSPWAANRDPLGQAHWLLLWLQSHGAGSTSWGRAGSAGQGKLISTQMEVRVSLRTSSSIKETSGFITCQSSNTLSVKWQGLPGTGSWVFSNHYWMAFT